MTAPNVSRLHDVVVALLDKGYADATDQVIRSVLRTSTTGIMETRLSQLQAEAERLAKEGKRLSADNPVVKALLSDFEDTLRKQGGALEAAAGDVLAGSVDAAGTVVKQLALPGVSEAQLAQIGVAWNTPDPETVASVVNYTTSPEWATKLDAYVNGITDSVKQAILQGIVNGDGPLTIARQVRGLVEGMPAYQANSLLRTLQLTSYRDATVLNRMANADILQYQIRIATLDDRTCMSCVALHGTRLPLDARVDDHWNGRCDSIPVVTGAEYNLQSGADWFDNLSEAQQRAMMGGAAYDAYTAGDIALADFVHKVTDPLFGEMIQEASLKGMLGKGAEQYYKN